MFHNFIRDWMTKMSNSSVITGKSHAIQSIIENGKETANEKTYRVSGITYQVKSFSRSTESVSYLIICKFEILKKD